MEREIANVAAASAMRGFRYMAFPPIVFDAPATPAAVWQEPDPASVAAATVTHAPPTQVAAALPPTAPPMATPRPAPLSAPQETAAAAPSAPEERLATAPPGRRFALLAEVSAELHRRGPR